VGVHARYAEEALAVAREAHQGRALCVADLDAGTCTAVGAGAPPLPPALYARALRRLLAAVNPAHASADDLAEPLSAAGGGGAVDAAAAAAALGEVAAGLLGGAARHCVWLSGSACSRQPGTAGGDGDAAGPLSPRPGARCNSAAAASAADTSAAAAVAAAADEEVAVLFDETAFVAARLRAFEGMAAEDAAAGVTAAASGAAAQQANAEFMACLLRTQQFSVHVAELPQPRFNFGGHT
jgi:hypothetical protein